MTLRRCLIVLCAFSFLRCASAPVGGAPRYFAPLQDTAHTAPFSEAVQAGDTLWVAGQLGVSGGALVAGGIEPETHQALENIKAILERHGTSMDRVVKCTAFLADIKEWPSFNRVYLEYFREHRPARSAVGVSGLALGARVEIECVASVPAGAR